MAAASPADGQPHVQLDHLLSIRGPVCTHLNFSNVTLAQDMFAYYTHFNVHSVLVCYNTIIINISISNSLGEY